MLIFVSRVNINGKGIFWLLLLNHSSSLIVTECLMMVRKVEKDRTCHQSSFQMFSGALMQIRADSHPMDFREKHIYSAT